MIAQPRECLLHLLRSPHGPFETFGRDVRMSARGETGHCGNIVVGPNLTLNRHKREDFAAMHSAPICPMMC